MGLPEPDVLPSRADTSCFYDPETDEIHIRSGVVNREGLARHEVGHYFGDYYWNDIVKAREFRAIFGSPNAAYPAVYDKPWAGMLRYSPSEYAGYLNAYAELHPEEDWAETFAQAMKEIYSGRSVRHRDHEVQEKVSYAKKCIRKALA